MVNNNFKISTYIKKLAPIRSKIFQDTKTDCIQLLQTPFSIMPFLIFGIFSSWDSSRRLWGNESIVPPLRCGHGLVPVSRSTPSTTYSRIHTQAHTFVYIKRDLLGRSLTVRHVYSRLRLYPRTVVEVCCAGVTTLGPPSYL